MTRPDSCFHCCLHLQSGEHSRFALAHLHLVHSASQEHLISSLHALDTSSTFTPGAFCFARTFNQFVTCFGYLQHGNLNWDP